MSRDLPKQNINENFVAWGKTKAMTENARGAVQGHTESAVCGCVRQCVGHFANASGAALNVKISTKMD
jgi:hypothetical protein